ncbi:MAG TPA: methyltransferase domain-containing protein [Actinomycetota bacterium]|jgi:ubiquinone/menaquinone biosynthesis C-methylase UbiE|nr:methyltransferase domain-containing protein [Actinomycetota bacterium]
MSAMAVRQSYFADQADHDEEFARLRKLEENRDPTTRRYLESLGIRKGWRCLEVGPGAGSIARWMAARVGRSGKVVAADINPRFLDDARIPNLEVRTHDITAGGIEERHYDLVHSRLVLMHIPEPLTALRRMVRALRPGGALLVEDGDLLSVEVVTKSHPDADTFVHVMNAIRRHVESTHTFDMTFGRRLPNMLEEAGLTEIDNEVTLRVARGGDERFRGPFDRYREAVLAKGDVTPKQWAIRDRCLDDPEFRWIGLAFVAAWGRRWG